MPLPLPPRPDVPNKVACVGVCACASAPRALHWRAGPERITRCGDDDGDSGAATEEIGAWLQMRGRCRDNAGVQCATAGAGAVCGA